MQLLAKPTVPLLFCLFTTPIFAATPRWSLLGPDGQDARVLAVAPSNPNLVYATGFDQEGIFRSLDGGVTWSWPEARTLAPGDFFPTVIAVDPQRPKTVYLGSERFGLTKSTDGGVTWSAFQTFLGGRSEVRALAIDPSRPNVLFAGVTAAGVFRSNDGGATWSRKTAGLPPSVSPQALAIDPRRPSVILASIPVNGPGKPELYRSRDGGESWAATALPAGQIANVLAFSGGRSALVWALTYSALYKSADEGASWSPVGLPPGGLTLTALAIDPKDPRTLLLGTGDGGIFRSRNSGASWSPVNTGLTSPNVGILAYNAAGTRVYAGTQGGIFQSADGQTWTRTMHGFATAEVTAVALGPGDPPVLWAGAPRLGLYRSINGGGLWRRSPFPTSSFFRVGDIVADPDHPGTVWALATQSEVGIFKTVDAGRTWSILPVQGGFNKLIRDPRDGALLLFGFGILRSVDGGLTWTSSATGIDPGDFLLDAAFDPASPRTLYASGGKPSTVHLHPPEPRIYKSTDSGLTWARYDSGLAALTSVQRVAVGPTGVYAAEADTLFRSTDGGAHWEEAGSLPHYPGLSSGISDLVAAPDGTLYAATPTGVLATSDGDDWTPLSDGLADLVVADLLLDPLDPGHLYAATEKGGIAVLPLDE
jgi:photosystem II stability/assembly factor-like uncharacterized protein